MSRDVRKGVGVSDTCLSAERRCLFGGGSSEPWRTARKTAVRGCLQHTSRRARHGKGGGGRPAAAPAAAHCSARGGPLAPPAGGGATKPLCRRAWRRISCACAAAARARAQCVTP